MTIWVPNEEPRDSLDWSKQYVVFVISRCYLSSLGFSTEAIDSLTEADMQRIADTYNNRNFLDFEEDMKFLVACEIIETRGGTHGEESLREES
jgi:hypothetical protein